MKLLTSIPNLRYNMNQSSPSHFKYQKPEFTPEPCHKDRLLNRGANVSGQKKPTAPFLIPRLRHLDTVDELKIEDPDKLGLKILHSKKRRYDETPPTANWNNGESLSNPAVRVKWAVGVMKRAQGYTTNQASKRDYAKTDGGLR